MNESLTSEKAAARSPRGKALLIGTAIALAVAAGLYFGGLWQGREQVKAEKEKIALQLNASNASLDTARAELAGASNRSYLMEAQARIYRAIADLDQRNFGIANEQLKLAAGALGKITGPVGALTTQQINQIRTAVAALDLNVAVNLEQQRAMLLQLAKSLDASS